MLILVRHAPPDVQSDVPPADWLLSEYGQSLASSLVPLLPTDALLVSSAEPKARQTLEQAGPVRTDPRFNEVVRDEAFGGNFREVRAAYVGGADHLAEDYARWEPRADVIGRFQAGIDAWSARAGDRPLVVGSHGMAMTIWLSSVVDLGDVAGFWRDLRFPDALAVDLAAATVTPLPGVVFAG
jgi:broad specificity phosphatase PhoE